MNNQNFKVFGDKKLLSECKINLQFRNQEYKDGKYINNYINRTILNKGNIREIAFTEYDFISIYVSYQDSMVSVLKFENIMRNARDYINHLYLSIDNSKVSVLYVGRAAEIESKKGFRNVLLPLNDFYKKENITENPEKDKIKKMFFDTY